MRRRAFLAGVALWAPVATAARAQTAAPAAPKPYQVEGFRSAKFGMTEAEVRRAIQLDFNVRESAITRETNPTELTTVLIISAQDVLPEVGKVRIAYTLGYQSRKLMQVVLAWGAGVSDTAPGTTSVLAGAKLLQTYFLAQPFLTEGRVVNSQMADGSSLLFQGLDEKGRLVQLVYGQIPWPPPKKPEEKPPPRVPFARVVYSEDPTNPDIFRIKKGQF